MKFLNSHQLRTTFSKTASIGFLALSTCLISSSAIAAEPQLSTHGSKQSFLSRHNTEMEFTFAVATTMVGLFLSEALQQKNEKQVPSPLKTKN